ncbi:bundle-forming pilus major subunit BfpA [Escherichia coli]|uniref:Beta 7 bundlin n=6 Tax=Escherichia coli TaxID=562 RepID=A7TTX1_ECOLX|nr:bundle-forming pilus major subunit BfpA [Escherichia coli]EFW6853143.1 pilus assembly protein [Shigella sonnei]EIJ2839236.1 pilus assembly protein [Salmonella enterica]BAE98278.1 bundlin-4a [Escherichia coli O153:H21]BAE98285.1 bundlin-4a [Escherichia coli O86a:H40]BAE98286.1 bundlin-4a [Escherichia coli O86a:H34]BAE98288.1 bundlin-4a [Escherichia coli O157:H45]
MVSKIMNKKYEKGLSLIESAMVLALAATVTAGVMFYYQSASDSNKSQNAISEVMSATSAINGLYIGQTSYTGLNSNILLNTSAIPDNYKDTKNNKITNPFGGELEVGPAANTSFGYYLTLTGLDKAACVSLATLNLGTSAKGYGVNINNPASTNSFNTSATSSNAKSSAITPAEAATVCAKTDSTNTVTYFMK